ncbi:MAG: hypothetical protein AAF802_02110 [Planctomycetota bacterium]
MWLIAIGLPASATAGEPIEEAKPVAVGSPGIISEPQAKATIEALLDWSLGLVPPHYEGDKGWNETKRVWAGVKFRRDGMRITTKRRWKELRHGRQVRYRVSFPPTPKQMPPVEVRLGSVRFVEATQSTPAAWQIDLELESPLDFSSRIERWNYGVQLFSIEVKGHLRLRLRLRGRLSANPDVSEIPPAIQISAVVKSSELELKQLNVDRISKVGGEVAEQWGDLIHQVAEEVLKGDINRRITTKLNRAIEKHKNRLRFSASELMTMATGGGLKTE